MSEVIHWLAHCFGLTTGTVVSKYDVDGNLWMGFKCSKCGAIQGRLCNKQEAE